MSKYLFSRDRFLGPLTKIFENFLSDICRHDFSGFSRNHFSIYSSNNDTGHIKVANFRDFGSKNKLRVVRNFTLRLVFFNKIRKIYLLNGHVF